MLVKGSFLSDETSFVVSNYEDLNDYLTYAQLKLRFFISDIRVDQDAID